METKFTPGPWEAVFPNDRPPYISADNRDTVIVSMPYWKHEYQEEVKANSHLIASAPDMHARIAKLEAALRTVRFELAGLIDPNAPDWMPALTNGNIADAECLQKAWEATEILKEGES